MKEKFPLFLASTTVFIILVSCLLSLVTHLPSTKPSSPPSTSLFSLRPSLFTPSPIILIAVGDVMLGRSVNAKMRSLNNFKYPFLRTADFLKSADITFINLESPFYDNCPTTNTGMIFCTDPGAIEGLAFAGVDIANLANNHIRNYGQEGINLTQSLLREKGIIFINHQENFWIIETKGTKFGFLGFDLTSGYQEGEIINAVKESRPKVDILIVSFHWGAEYAKEPSSQQIELAHQVIDAGASLILGHHPHVIQRIEDYTPPHQNIGGGGKGKIVYSLGNFIFDQPWSEATKRGLVGIFTFQDKKLVNSEFKEIYIQDYSQPEFME